MISARGPQNILVLDSVGVPISDVCEAVLRLEYLDKVTSKYLITPEEVYLAIETMCDTNPQTENDFVKFRIDTEDNGDIAVETSGLSDWVYLTIVTYGRMLMPEETRFRTIYAYGMESIMVDILTDLKQHKKDFENSVIHNLVYESFVDAFGPIKQEDIDMLLGTLHQDDILGTPGTIH